MAKAIKILVSGDVDGKFRQIFKRVGAVNRKNGPFDMLLCVGEFFGADNSEWEQVTSGEISVPLSTYILGPTNTANTEQFKDPDGCELCNNVTYLGKKGVFSGSTGLQIAYLSGIEASGQGHSKHTQFTTLDVDTLITSLGADNNKYPGIDVLLTSQWPKAVDKYGTAVTGADSDLCGSALLSWLAKVVRPRYHFCGLEGVHYERQPYRNHKVLQEKERHVTRVITLAKVGNAEKQKFLYAFNIVPLTQMDQSELTKQPTDVTECPYNIEEEVKKAKKVKADQEKGQQFFYDMGDGQKKEGRKRGQDDKGGGPNKQRKSGQFTGPCWFCLGSPEVDKHLVVDVATQTYLAMAKGGLTPDHTLILPIGHYQSTVQAPPDVVREIEQYKSSLRKCMKSHGKAVVFYERNYKTAHLQIQVVPVPADLADEVKETFIGCGLSQDISLQEIPKHTDLKQVVPEGAPYFYVELPSGDKLLFRISKGFPINFGREALAHDSLLDLPDRVDWRNCKSTKEEESEITAVFRKIFEPFSPSS